MSEANRRRAVLTALLIVALCVFIPGLRWGLPSRAADPYLFGDEPVWDGAKILSLAGGWDEANVGADVDRNPLAQSSQPILLNETDAQCAEIIRRYRLFSHQPDEMITFRALSQMNPGEMKLDPKLYQYGGLWIYPVGALLKVGSVLKLIDLRGDLAFYLDNPEAFGRFYVVARAYSAAWGLVGVWAVFWIVHRMTAGLFWPAVGALCYTFMPVVVNMAHEAKPHLPGAVLMLLAIVAATKYVETGRAKWWILAGALCGAAFGMVISSLIGFAILPTMTLLRHGSWRHRAAVTAGAALFGGAVYALTNPYVPINYFTNYEVLRSNISNSTAMYGVGSPGRILLDGFRLMAEGSTLLLLLAGVVGIAIVSRRQCRHVGWLLAAPAAVATMQFFMLAAGKPGEYARFALLPDIAIAIAAAAGFAQLPFGPRSRVFLGCLLALLVMPFGVRYIVSFVRDVGPLNTRLRAAEDLRSIPGPVYLLAEPAPYSCPPIDLFDRELYFVSSTAHVPRREGAVLAALEEPIQLKVGDIALPRRVGRAGFFERAPISWASRSFVLIPLPPAASRPSVGD